MTNNVDRGISIRASSNTNWQKTNGTAPIQKEKEAAALKKTLKNE